jgi:voltage-gated sodium channel
MVEKSDGNATSEARVPTTRLKLFVESSGFVNFILGVIIVNSIVLGLQTSPYFRLHFGGLLILIDELALGIFVVELLL